MSLRTLGTIVVAVAFALPASAVAQNCGWSHIDHLVSLDNSGVWNPNVSRGITAALTIAEVGGALWEGSETRFGKTMWQGIDSELIGAGAAQVGKYIFTRARPDQQDNPCLWFQGGHHYSFPSGEAAVSASLVTPYVLEYGHDNPAAYLLLLLPLYTGVTRVKNQAHWQTDVLAGWAVGGLSGWYAHSREVPILIEILPHGFAVGLRKTF
ncbi:MAG TPA: phosphatase PAP2 family protein [Casimicrobiaceae bacterium]|nr:phosphatase PAP2 family protein [Casimicrobiaceae bacterium]